MRGGVRLAVRAGVAVAACAAVLASGAAGTGPDQRGHIVFFSDAGAGQQDLFAFGRDGSRIRLAAPGDSPALSWDGTLLAYSRFDRHTRETDLYVGRTDGTRARRLTTLAGDERGAAWSPDGDELAFEQLAAGAAYASPVTIETVDTASGATRDVAQGLFTAFGPAWSPDGASLAFAAPDGIWTVARDGSGLRRIASSATLDGPWEFGAELRLNWLAADDLRLGVGHRNSSAAPHLFRLRPDGAASEALRSPCGDGSLPMWSPNGRFFACGATELYRSSGRYEVTIGDEPAFTVARHGWDLTPPLAVLPDGSAILAGGRIDYTPGIDIWIMLGDGSQRRQLTMDAPSESAPKLSRDGSRIVFVRGYYESETLGTLWLMRSDGTRVRPLRRDLHGEDPAWSPDGKEIAFDDSKDVYVVAARGSGKPQRLIRDALEPSWSPDGRSLVFIRPGPGSQPKAPLRPDRILVARADGTHARTIVTGGSASENVEISLSLPTWSPDGTRLAYVENEQGDPWWGALWVVALRNPTPRAILRERNNNIFCPTWSPNGRRIAVNIGVNLDNYDSEEDPGAVDFGIFSLRSSGGGLTRLTPGDAGQSWGASWSR